MKKIIIAMSLMIIGSFGASLTFPDTSFAESNKCDKKGRILTLKPWYDGLTKDDCSIKDPGSDADSQANFIWKIVLNIVDDLLQLIGYTTVGYIMYGGFLMMTSNGAPDKAAHGRKTIMSAAIGLVIALASVALVNFISSKIGV
ncbi:pilin [Candidatus Nanosynbacter sp. TM7-075]|uniref:pilin n=1 Tax=Candidatus Nanosynbacter sp. TM7-075 TaxID=2902633 RepID=UPI001FB63BCD|nr:pilin [Candidatus Nanosynbacter sp. TM7-075]MCJ1967251.1 pilin [Candidatus Nanosynbacter sp. TM7-075]